jgi:phosphoribosylformimino-5-aminoimidazole carboxamide ribotide isomerase
MQLIPVIDLKDGIVVHARQGNRDEYAPVKSTLCNSSDIFEVVNAFLSLYRFQTLYIADLNAITGHGNNADLIAKVSQEFIQIIFWVDSGYPIQNFDLPQPKNFLPVLGSESFNEENITEISKWNKNFILSLDFSSSGILGPKTLFSNKNFWPDNIIIMSLPNVGSNKGPNLEIIATYCKQYPQYNIIAAGGIRGGEDLIDLERIGVRQALVATALHTGKINQQMIANFQTKKYPEQAGYFSNS